MGIIQKFSIIAVSSIVSTSALFISSSEAQTTTTSNSTSNSASSAHVQSTGTANSEIYLDQRAPGSTTVRSAPAVQAPSMGSGHPCAIGGSIGISIIGGGASAGMSRVDEACLLAQMGQGQAALIMIARRDSEACSALRQVGSIPASSVCSASEARVAERNQRAQARLVRNQQSVPDISSFVTCSRNEAGQIVAMKQRGTPYSDEQVSNYCRN